MDPDLPFPNVTEIPDLQGSSSGSTVTKSIVTYYGTVLPLQEHLTSIAIEIGVNVNVHISRILAF